ncbi:MAG: rRNA adenine N-6-methyltransferase family protein [Oscillospiraceae bacterium]
MCIEVSMDLCNINDIKALLTRHGFHFSKAKGQNFLTQSWVPREIVLDAGIDDTCGVLEVGPGIGPLTQQLCRNAKRSSPSRSTAACSRCSPRRWRETKIWRSSSAIF